MRSPLASSTLPLSLLPTRFEFELYRVLLAGADVVALLDRHHEDAAVADLSRAGGADDRLDGLIDRAVGDDDFDFHFRQQADFVLASAIDGRVPLLPAVAAHLGHGHARDVHFSQGFLDVVHHVGADYGLDEFHALSFNM